MGSLCSGSAPTLLVCSLSCNSARLICSSLSFLGCHWKFMPSPSTLGIMLKDKCGTCCSAPVPFSTMRFAPEAPSIWIRAVDALFESEASLFTTASGVCSSMVKCSFGTTSRWPGIAGDLWSMTAAVSSSYTTHSPVLRASQNWHVICHHPCSRPW